jgi:hypothetical protein
LSKSESSDDFSRSLYLCIITCSRTRLLRLITLPSSMIATLFKLISLLIWFACVLTLIAGLANGFLL